MLWLALLLVALVIGAVLARPFFVEPHATSDAASIASALARDQMEEVERELSEGRIDEPQAARARLDIKRRLLTRLPAEHASGRRLSAIERKFLAGAFAGGVTLASFILYGLNGSPGIPSARRTTLPQQTSAAGAENTAPAIAAAPSPQQPSAPGGNLMSVDDAIERLAARLAKSPEDANGWRMLGWSYAGVGRMKEAAQAYSKAIALQPAIGPLRTARGTALVAAANGKVPDEAKGDFEDALRLDPGDAQASYGLGLAKEQSGDKSAALDLFLKALASGATAEPWAVELAPRIRALATELKVDVSRHLPPDASPSRPLGGILDKLTEPRAPLASRDRGPTPEDMTAAEKMSDADRQRMINQMVEGLQRRLDQQPRDAEGWIKLIRSRQVLGQKDMAQAALKRAADIFSDSPAEWKRIEASAREAGVAP